MTEFFKTLADETRLRCMVLIFENQEICVCELIHALELPQSKISRHLSLMRLNALITSKREKQWVLYSINPSLNEVKRKIIELFFNEVKNKAPFSDDRKRLAEMKKLGGIHV